MCSGTSLNWPWSVFWKILSQEMDLNSLVTMATIVFYMIKIASGLNSFSCNWPLVLHLKLLYPFKTF